MSLLNVIFLQSVTILAIGVIAAKVNKFDYMPYMNVMPTMGVCTCGIFNGTIANLSHPGTSLLFTEKVSDSVIDVKCKEICYTRTEYALDNDLEGLCRQIKNTQAVQISSFFKMNDNNWIYSGMTAKENLCCSKGATVECDELDKDYLHFEMF